MDQLIRDVHSTERAEGVDRIYVPGEIEHENRAERLAKGIPLPVALVEEISAIGADFGLPLWARSDQSFCSKTTLMAPRGPASAAWAMASR